MSVRCRSHSSLSAIHNVVSLVLVVWSAFIFEWPAERASAQFNVPDAHVAHNLPLFASVSANVGSIALTLYRCPSADELSATACTLVTDSRHVAGIFRPGWPEAALSGFADGQASWQDIPLQEYTVGYGGLAAEGEMAAIPEIDCVSPHECQVTLDAPGEVANLELFVFPVPATLSHRLPR